ncbi:hypothetical protein CUMW_275960 [Citrus unshiu]|uniref:Uncharacterized protein n=1 Tax=Citrus unshiu TaxID=55188 RepID=A0A2H5N0C3_CITUN|nr:hypothetical protein CUMW_275960 [Citrus unshiu]
MITQSLIDGSSFKKRSAINFDTRSAISSEWRLVGKPSSGNDTTLGHSLISKFRREKAILLREMTQDLDIHISESFEDGGDYANRQVRIPEHRIFQLQLISTGKAEQPEERKQAKRSLISASL